MSTVVKRSFWGLAGLAGLALALLLASGCLEQLLGGNSEALTVANQALDRADAVAAALPPLKSAGEELARQIDVIRTSGTLDAQSVAGLASALSSYQQTISAAVQSGTAPPAVAAPPATNWVDILDRLIGVLAGALGGGGLIAARRNKAAGRASPAIPDAQPSPTG
jgi:hypothetical protein